jgi:phospholipase/lecithinase/hemolysin
LSTLPLTLITGLPTAAFSASLSAQNFEEIYVFGDSLSDDGNVFEATEEDYPPSPPYFEGRLSNGPIWVEYLASELGAESNNFAYGGSKLMCI